MKGSLTQSMFPWCFRPTDVWIRLNSRVMFQSWCAWQSLGSLWNASQEVYQDGTFRGAVCKKVFCVSKHSFSSVVDTWGRQDRTVGGTEHKMTRETEQTHTAIKCHVCFLSEITFTVWYVYAVYTCFIKYVEKVQPCNVRIIGNNSLHTEKVGKEIFVSVIQSVRLSGAAQAAS